MDATDSAGDNTGASTSEKDGLTNAEIMPDYEAAREAIIRAFSSTVNGCMKEMGYFPGLLQLLQDTRHDNMVLREQSAKLHADNVSLSRIASTQKEQITNLCVRPPAERDVELDGLRRHITHLVAERDETIRAYQHLRMVYEQCRRELAELTAFTQSRLPGRIEIVRQAPQPPMLVSPRHQGVEGAPVMPPFAVPSHGPPMGGPLQHSYPPSVSGIRGMPGQAQPMPMPVSRPMPASRIRFLSSSSINTSMSKVSINDDGNAGSPITPDQNSPVASSSRPATSSPVVKSEPIWQGSSSRKSSAGLSTESMPHVIDLTEDDAIEDAPRKKRRVEVEDIDMDAVVEEPDVPGRQHREADEDATSDPGDAEDGAEALDPDGRRSEEACLAVAFEGDAEGKMWCMMCKLRFQKNLTQKAPSAFVGASKRELVEHCEREHPAGWGTLRGTPSQS